MWRCLYSHIFCSNHCNSLSLKFQQKNGQPRCSMLSTSFLQSQILAPSTWFTLNLLNFPSPPLKSDMCSTFPLKSPCSSIFPKFPHGFPMFSPLFPVNALISPPGPGHAALQAAPPGGRRGAAGGVGTEGAAASGDLHQPGHGDWARLKKIGV